MSLPAESDSEPGPIRRLEERLGHRFSNPELLKQALTHPSRAHEEGSAEDGNERFEFLGDAVLGLLVAEFLMEAHPDASEGILSRARAAAVNTQALAQHARRLGIDGALRLGRSEEKSAGRSKPSILENAFEAVLCALYLDGGIETARRLVRREFGEALASASEPPIDAKSCLQERLHAQGKPSPTYRTIDTHGPDHARIFDVEVYLGERVLGSGRGRSKREAEQQAARAALATFEA